MAIFKSGNPTLNEKIFQSLVRFPVKEVMTERGTLNKFFFLSLMVMASASLPGDAYNRGKM